MRSCDPRIRLTRACRRLLDSSTTLANMAMGPRGTAEERLVEMSWSLWIIQVQKRTKYSQKKIDVGITGSYSRVCQWLDTLLRHWTMNEKERCRVLQRDGWSFQHFLHSLHGENCKKYSEQMLLGNRRLCTQLTVGNYMVVLSSMISWS